MADYINPTYVPLSELMSKINSVKYNPSAIQRMILDHLYAVTNKQVDIVDPTNPFIFLLESSSVNTAAAIIENAILLSKQYPSLSQTEDDLYRHMSDVDYIDRFATPAKTVFSMMILYADMVSKMIYDPVSDSKLLTIPRNTAFSINGITFSLQYPINIRLFNNNILQISYDATIVSPLQSLSTNIISYQIRNDSSNNSWIQFDMEVYQFTANSTQYPIQSSRYFEQSIIFTDQYYYCRVWYKSLSTDNQWVEIRTTHTDQVYDPYVPTAVLQVVSNTLQVMIPPVYINSGLIDGVIRVDVYTTLGAISVNMSNYTLGSFTTVMQALDEQQDINIYTNAMSNVSYIAYCDKMVVGGSNGLTQDELRTRVINNAIGDRQIPITNLQLAGKLNILGYDIVKNVDTVTNRIFLATRNLPKPLSPAIATAANIGIDTLIVSFDSIGTLPTVMNNTTRMTILSKTVYRSDNGIITIYPADQLEYLMSQPISTIASTVSAIQFLYSPFYYVLDNSLNEFEMRAYHLDSPAVGNLNFISQNPTVDLVVNTSAYSIEKTDRGYRLTLVVSSDSFYKKLSDTYVQSQIAYIPPGESEYAYLNGTIAGLSTNGERIFTFDIDTNYDIDKSDYITLTNFSMFSNSIANVPSPLVNTFTVFYTTTSIPNGYIADTANSLIGKLFLPPNAVAITREELTITLGYSLHDLWSRTRSVAATTGYKTYTQDIPLVYPEDVYQVDPNTNSIFTIDANNTLQYTLLHRRNDPVLDENGQQVYLHRAGDVILDDSGNPIPIGSQYTLRHLDMLFIDGCYYFANDSVYNAYRAEIADLITAWVTNDLANITKEVLEQTRIYYYPKKQMHTVNVMLSTGIVTSIDACQSFTVNLYVNTSTFNNSQLRERLQSQTISVLYQSLMSKTVSVSDIISNLRTAYGNSVISLSVSGLCGGKYDTVTVVDDAATLSLKKILVATDSNTTIVEEDVTVNFINYQV